MKLVKHTLDIMIAASKNMEIVKLICFKLQTVKYLVVRSYCISEQRELLSVFAAYALTKVISSALIANVSTES